MRLLSCLALSLALASVGSAPAQHTVAAAGMLLQQPSAPPTPATPSTPAASIAPVGAKVWVGRYAEYEAFLRTAEIDRVSGFKKGVTGKVRSATFKPGGLAAGGALRNIRPGRYDGYFESYKSEVAAYRIDRLLQLDIVPPTIERQYGGEPVSLQLRVEHVKDLQDIKKEKIATPTGSLAWIRQLARQRVFDDLVANIDENETNLLFDDQWHLIKIDCSRCFTNVMTEPFDIGKAVTLIDRPVFERLKALDKATLEREIGEFVEGGAIDALLARRDDLVKKFEKLAKNKGDGHVFLP